MGLSQALANAVAGLKVNQLGLQLVSSNIANNETPGYVRKTLNQVETVTGSVGAGVNVTGVNRELDSYVQQQVRTEQSGASFADLQSSILASLQSVFGTPGQTGTLENALNDLTTSVQGLSTSPDTQSAKLGVVNSAQALAQQLNSLSAGVQSLRGQAEAGISTSVDSVNQALQQIGKLNTQLQGSGGVTDGDTATLEDQRDNAIDQLSQLLDVRVSTDNNNQVSVFTSNGIELVGSQVATLSFNAQANVTANTLYNADPTKSGVGTITANFPGGGSIDLLQANAIHSGAIGAYLQLRDTTLPQAETQLDQVAASLSSLLSDRTTAGVPAGGPAPAPSGFNLDLSGVQNGNVVHLSYTDPAGTSHQVSIVRVDDPTALPLKPDSTLDPNDDQVIGVNFSAGIGSIVSQLNTALGGSLQFSGAGSTLTVLDKGEASKVNAASVTATTTTLQNGGPELPLFVDSGGFYTGAITGNGPQYVGLAGRIQVNSQLVADPSTLVKLAPTTASGDTTRPNFIYQQLTTGKAFYPPATGFGTSATPLQSTLQSFSQQITAAQAGAASAAKQVADGQDVVLSTLQQKFNQNAGVNIDDEMAHLLSLQNAYAANARVMSTCNDMFNALLQAQQ
jgi:flagellar hook-associated protein 1 FlgK